VIKGEVPDDKIANLEQALGGTLASKDEIERLDGKTPFTIHNSSWLRRRLNKS
jgi:hypothetical protein